VTRPAASRMLLASGDGERTEDIVRAGDERSQAVGRPVCGTLVLDLAHRCEAFLCEVLDEREAELFRQCTGRSNCPWGRSRPSYSFPGDVPERTEFQIPRSRFGWRTVADWKQISARAKMRFRDSFRIRFQTKPAFCRRYCQGLIETPIWPPL